MYNRTNQILEQYPFLVSQTYKGRGALICDTDQGLKIMKEYKGSKEKAEFLYEVLMFLKEQMDGPVDTIVKTKEDLAVSKDGDETSYLIRDWLEGRECDVRNREEIIQSIRMLGKLHTILREYQGEVPEFMKIDATMLLEEYKKHNRELKKVKNYVEGKRKKNSFETEYIKHCDYFIKQANGIIQLQEKEVLDERPIYFGLCHGDFNHHNVSFTKEGPMIVNFEKMAYDAQVSDLCNFMRKILEKHNWNMGLGMELLDTYQKLIPLSQREMGQLYIRLAFPEKFWKISNHYYNNSKAWVSERDIEKLKKVVAQNEEKDCFLSLLSYNLVFEI